MVIRYAFFRFYFTADWFSGARVFQAVYVSFLREAGEYGVLAHLRYGTEAKLRPCLEAMLELLVGENYSL